jgi:hypothetical protein
MASKRGSSSSSKRNSSRSGSRKGNGRRSTQRKHKKSDFPDYSVVDPNDVGEGPDVLVAVPVVKVDEIDIEVDDLHAQVAVMAQVRKLVNLSVGADVRLGKVELNIQGVEAQALLKARLDNVTAILERVLLTLDRNPELLQSVGRSLEHVGSGAGQLVDRTGDAVEDVGEGAGGAVEEVGKGAGQAVGEIGQGASQGLSGLGQGAAQGVGQLGQGANQALGGLGQGAGQGVAGVGQGVQQVTGELAQGGQGGGQGGGQ